MSQFLPTPFCYQNRSLPPGNSISIRVLMSRKPLFVVLEKDALKVEVTEKCSRSDEIALFLFKEYLAKKVNFQTVAFVGNRFSVEPSIPSDRRFK